MSSPRLLFSVEEHRYLIELEAVAELAPATKPRLIPGVPLSLAGIMNVRGEPVPVVDGGAALQGRCGTGGPHALLLDAEGHRIGVLVSSVARIERRSPARPEGAREEPSPFPFLQNALLPDGEVRLVEVGGLLARARELLCPSAMGGVT
ncbi:MAG: chemotaxis protein CheW [Myxococcota bacterium]